MIKQMKNKVIIFDCDGTILDTFLLIEKTVFATFAKMLPSYPLTKEEAHQFFGPLIDDSFKRYAKDDVEKQALIDCYIDINNKLMANYIRTFDGIEELLQKLKAKGYFLAIVSNKVSKSIIKGLKICKIDQYFDLIIGAEKMKLPKPNPDGIYQVLDYYQTTDAIFVGDTIIDIQTGQNANLKTIGVTWCKTSKESFIKNQATFIVDKPEEILTIIGE